MAFRLRRECYGNHTKHTLGSFINLNVSGDINAKNIEAVTISGSIETVGTINVSDGIIPATPLKSIVQSDGTKAKAQWAARISGSSIERASDVSVNNKGEVVAIGRYSSNSINLYNGDGTLGDTLSKSGSYDVYVVKYDKNGNIQWASKISSSGSNIGHGISINDYGEIVATGEYSGEAIIYNGDGTSAITLPNPSATDGFLVKYSSSGKVLWATKMVSSGSAGSYDAFINNDGTIVATGAYDNNLTIQNSDGSTFSTLGNSGSHDVFIAQYNRFGKAIWATRIASSSNDYGNGVSINEKGEVVATGYYYGSVTVFNSDGSTFSTMSNQVFSEIFVVKFDDSGFGLWATRMIGGSTDIGIGIDINNKGEVFATGFTYNNPFTIYNSSGSVATVLQSVGSDDAFLVKFDIEGNFDWVTRVVGSNNDQGRAVSVNENGEIVLLGHFYSATTIYNSSGSIFGNLASPSSSSVFVVKFDKDGNGEWATQINGSSTDEAGGVCINDCGEVIVSGRYFSNPLTVFNSDGSTFGVLANEGSGVDDGFVIKYTDRETMTLSGTEKVIVSDDALIRLSASIKNVDGLKEETFLREGSSIELLWSEKNSVWLIVGKNDVLMR